MDNKPGNDNDIMTMPKKYADERVLRGALLDVFLRVNKAKTRKGGKAAFGKS